MSRIYLPSLGTADWQRLLADPQKHWKRGRSALEMAVSWESVRDTERGLPAEVAAILDTVEALSGAKVLAAFPEHQVRLVGGGHASQNDLWAVLRAPCGLVSLTVEAKAGEPLGSPVSEWLQDRGPNSGKPDRIAALASLLGLGSTDLSAIRYQLLHRAASALLEAERFQAKVAVMLVQSFNRMADSGGLQDFRRLVSVMGCESTPEEMLYQSQRQTAVPLYFGWVNSMVAADADFVRVI